MLESENLKMSRTEFMEYLRLDKARNDAEIEDIRHSLKNSQIPIPDELLERMLGLFITSANDVLRSHPGFAFAERRKHFRSSLSIMFLSLDDLQAALANFKKLATDETTEIILKKNADKLEAIAQRIQKELFVTGNSAASLVDHVRRLQNKFEIAGFNEKLKECILTDGLHEFIIALRVLLHHLHIVEAEWSIHRDFVTGNRGAGFRLQRSEIDRALVEFGEKFSKSQLRSICVFLRGYPKEIDLAELFANYRRRLEAFYNWLDSEIDRSAPAELRDYDRCVLEKMRRNVRMEWNAVIGNLLNWQKIPDLHRHLSDFLTPEQLVAVHQRPRNSKEQADLIIDCIDTHGAADLKLRSSVYLLFEKLSLQEAESKA